MEAKNLGLSLFDILGYLLPGYVLLVCLSVIEATFVHSSFFSLSLLGTNWIFSTIFAYFLGHICFFLATFSKDSFYFLFKKPRERNNETRFLRFLNKIRLWIYKVSFGNQDKGLSEPLYQTVKKSILETYRLNTDDSGKVTTMERYLLADSYVLASGGADERASLFVREGFYKSSTVAFAILSMAFLVSLLV